MEPKQNYLLVGMFVLLAVAGVFIFVLWLSGSDDRNYSLYHTYFTDSVTGLSEGASVKYRGVEVGKVQKIAIDPADLTRIVITMRIADGTPITQDTVAVLKLLGITGVAYVEFEGGSKESPPLAPQGDEIPIIASKPSTLTQVVNSIPEILDRFSRVTEQLTKLMNDENLQHISSTLANVESLSGSFADNGDMAGMLKEVRETAATLNDLAASSREDLQKTLKQTARATEELANLLENTSQFSQSGYQEMGALMVELKKTTREIQGLARGLREDPSKIIIPDKPGGVKVP